MKERKQGFICIARNLLKHPRFAPRGAFTAAEAWLWILNAAAFKAICVPVVSGRHKKVVPIERGQLTFSIRFMARAWRWSPSRVERFLNDLKIDTSIETQTICGQTLITLCNYDTWQMRPEGAGGQTGTQTSTQTSTKKKEGKELNKILLSLEEDFREWYSAYPRKKAKQGASKAYRKLINSGDITHADLMARTKLFAAHRRAQPPDQLQFCPYPASWLNSAEYADEIEAAALPSGGMRIEAPTRDPRSFTKADWRDRLALIEGGARWPSQWGPKPGEPGCLVPAALLVRPVSIEPRSAGGAL